MPLLHHRFGEFEKFIYDFLVGSDASGTSSSSSSGGDSSIKGGEGLRLKLQTPLFVADALMEAARVRLDGELAAAEGELAALDAVRRQLAKFKVRDCGIYIPTLCPVHGDLYTTYSQLYCSHSCVSGCMNAPCLVTVWCNITLAGTDSCHCQHSINS